MECQKEKNLKTCPCTYLPAGKAGPDCPRKGICCECIKHHRENGELPACYFSAEAEKTYDRSIKKFIEDYQSR